MHISFRAMSSGCPIVCTPCGGPKEYVINGQTGIYLNELNDHLAMANAIRKICSDRKVREVFQRIVES